MNPADSLFIAFQDAVAGRYSLDRELGRGGMGIVYLAREVRLDRLVALKLLPPELAADDDVRARFLREARVAARLSHPNIIPIFAVEEIGDFVFFAMSYIDGETLTQRVHNRGPLAAAEGARVLREAAWALAYAHAQGIIHRDVKPDNILLEAGSGRTLVADFGIASVAEDAATSSAITGTPEFMSPEQALGEALDARSDLYALGATAFYMYSGRFVFDGRTPMEIIGRRVTETAPPVASLGCPVPRRIASIIDRCLSRDPAHRPANGQVLAEQLGAAMEERRELPAPLRSFLTTARLSGRGTFAGSVGILAATALGASLFGATAGWTTLVASAVLLPVAAWIVAARQLIKNGFEHTDVESAFKAMALREREERGTIASATVTERIVRWYAIVVTPTSYAAYWALHWQPTTIEEWRAMQNSPLQLGFFRTMGQLYETYNLLLLSEVYLPILIASGALAGAAALALFAARRDADSAFWSELWTNRIGRGLFAFARKLVGRGSRRVAVTHRATELSLGLAADALFAQLPKATRESLSEMPSVLQRLQVDAQRLRAEIDRLQEALNDAGAAALSEEFAPIRETRDELQSRHRDAVAQLETLRLGLLRLHAGSVSVDTVTTHLRLASEVSEHVERLIAARSEVVKELEYPRPEVPSPV